MKTTALFILLCASLGLAQENQTFWASAEGTANLTMTATSCQGTYLYAPISDAKLISAHTDSRYETDQPFKISLPDGIWISTASNADCENLRLELNQRSLLSSVATFEIEGSSSWQTDRIGGGCYGHKCQSYVTNANLTGNLQGFKISDIYSEHHWLGRWPYIAPAPVPQKPRPHCHPMIVDCD